MGKSILLTFLLILNFNVAFASSWSCKEMVESTVKLFHDQKTGERSQYAIATLGALTKMKNATAGVVSVIKEDNSLATYFAEAKNFQGTCLVVRISNYNPK